MRLIYCKECHDLLRINQYIATISKCACGNVKAKPDGDQVIYCGDAVPITLDDASFGNAIQYQQPSMVKQFKAYVEPRKCYHFKKVESL